MFSLASRSFRSAMTVTFGVSGAIATFHGCSRDQDPSPTSAPTSSSSAVSPNAVAASVSALASASASASPSASPSGSASIDAGPVMGDEVIHSIAIETHVRAVAGRGARTLGYLRAGAARRRSNDPVGTDGCKGGWYAVEPEGFICNGPDATLDPNAKILTYASPGPKRGQPLPYQYAHVRAKVPHYYAVLPEKQDRRRIEGGDVEGVILGAYHSPDPNLDLLGPARDIPQELLEGARVPRPPGAAPRLRYKFHTGRAEPKTRLALMSWFEHDKRRWAVTSQLDLVAIDRLRIIKPPAFHGVALEEGQSLPVAFLRLQSASGYRYDEEGKLIETVRLTHRQPFRLTGEKKEAQGKTLLASHEGIWVPEAHLTLVEARDNIPTFVKNDTLRWLDISIRNQTLVAYRGKQPVYATLISTGAGGMGDPETTRATPRGLYSIFSKHVTTKMSGDEIGSEYLIEDVPYVQYFHRGYALHGAFWHDNFGRVQSHGCVNLAPADAAWVFEFTGPDVPEGWHGRYVKSGGTPVLIRP